MGFQKKGWSVRGIAATLAVGLLGGWAAVNHVIPFATMAAFKLQGKAEHCPWTRLAAFPAHATRFAALLDNRQPSVKRQETDPSLGIARFSTPKGDFWVREQGEHRNGEQLLAYLIAEHTWMTELHPAQSVRQGDIVVDCGAHVGVFTRFALDRGAAKVLAVEPEPVNAECIRRNFKSEIAEGRVILVEKGVWSKAGEIDLSLGVANSGMGSMVHVEHGSHTVKVPIDRLDKIVADAGLDRVSFIKMDIEGAEREALKGASETLEKHRPRLMLDSYHRPDDPVVLPPIIRAAHADYKFTCGPCEMTDTGGLVPHVTFYE